jgi:hypothetical protein
MRDVAIDQNSHADEFPFDLSEGTRLMQIAPFVFNSSSRLRSWSQVL